MGQDEVFKFRVILFTVKIILGRDKLLETKKNEDKQGYEYFFHIERNILNVKLNKQILNFNFAI
jgi:hypothetical protein